VFFDWLSLGGKEDRSGLAEDRGGNRWGTSSSQLSKILGNEMKKNTLCFLGLQLSLATSVCGKAEDSQIRDRKMEKKRFDSEE